MIAEPFDPLDRGLAALLDRLAGGAPPPVRLAAMLASQAVRHGHVCVDLRAAAAEPIPDQSPELRPIEFTAWQSILAESPVVGRPSEFKPLILDPDGRLYLHRYWTYETIVAQGVTTRLATTEPAGSPPSRPVLASVLDRYFNARESGADAFADQRQAVETACRRRFAVISGGPGTGKTYTIALLVAALLELAGTDARRFRIALAAPTGKAAIRLQEALQAARERLPCPPTVRDSFPTTTTTLHRLLGAIPGGARFRHNEAEPLPFDTVIIDEASMVDVALMARLFSACRPATRVVLVGDMDQLASVEAGAVLGDICDGVRGGPTSAAPTPAPLAASIVPLRKNHRFQDGAGIATLSQALKDGDADTALQLLGRGDDAVTLRRLPGRKAVAQALVARLQPQFDAILDPHLAPADALRLLGEFRILCALRHGPFGTETVNAGLEQALRNAGRIHTISPFYPGRPVLIRKNDYNLRLFNGDVGLVLPRPGTGELRVWFLDAEGQPRDFAPGRLPEHETVFAMTVHKSQGSEFKDVLLLLPDADSPVLTRELVYTGVTRARRRVELWLLPEVLRQALARRTARTSGLAARLWKIPSTPGH